jgi:hypothetical protein
VFPNDLFSAESRAKSQVQIQRSIAAVAAYRASNLYSDTRRRALLARLWAVLARRRLAMHTLADSVDRRALRAQHALGVQTIPIGMIRGSEGRSTDFDAAFRPTHDRMRQRWLGVATAMCQGLVLPPVDVIQVGAHYFVRDGHHRVSAARALGQVEIEASVMVWVVEAPAVDPRPSAAEALA